MTRSIQKTETIARLVCRACGFDRMTSNMMPCPSCGHRVGWMLSPKEVTHAE